MDFAETPLDEYPLMLHHPYFQFYRMQVVKQADLVQAMHLRGDAFSTEEEARNFAYYDARRSVTPRSPQLRRPAGPQAAAEVGHLDLAYDYWAELAFTDILHVHGNVNDGVHIAAAAGTWAGAVAGCDARDRGGWITFAPRLPLSLTRLRFRMKFQGRTLLMDVQRHGDRGDEATTYRLLAGEHCETAHHGEPVVVAVGDDVRLPVPPPPRVDRVTQPFGRAAHHRT